MHVTDPRDTQKSRRDNVAWRVMLCVACCIQVGFLANVCDLDTLQHVVISAFFRVLLIIYDLKFLLKSHFPHLFISCYHEFASTEVQNREHNGNDQFDAKHNNRIRIKVEKTKRSR